MKTLKLNEEQLNLFRKQILIVLADYSDMNLTELAVGATKNPLQHEGTRVDISERILNNLLIIGRSK